VSVNAALRAAASTEPSSAAAQGPYSSTLQIPAHLPQLIQLVKTQAAKIDELMLQKSGASRETADIQTEMNKSLQQASEMKAQKV